jgi:ferredoxin
MKLYLDQDRCEGHQECHAVDPSLFPLTDEGNSAVLDGQEVPAGSEEEALDGVAACPLMALSVAT